MNGRVDSYFLLLERLKLNTDSIYVNKMKHGICALLDNFAAYNGNSLLTSRDNISVPSSRGTNPKKCIMCDFRLPPLSR